MPKKVEVGDLVYYSIDTGESIIGIIIEINLQNSYKNIIEWSNGLRIFEDYDSLIELHDNYLAYAKQKEQDTGRRSLAVEGCEKVNGQ